MPLAPEVAPVIDMPRAKLRPIQQRSQIMHADFAGNVSFADDCDPAIIDAVLWYGGSADLLVELIQLDECRQMIARGLIFRLAIDGLFAVEHPGAFWSAAIARDLASALPLLECLKS